MAAFRRFTVLCAAFIASRGMAAQALVHGTVYDSLVTHRWLAGATITIPEINRSVTSDERGRFDFGRVLAGRYTISFRHHSLDSLDLPRAVLVLPVPDTGTINAQLSMPAPRAYANKLCRTAVDSQGGVITGSVRDVDDSTPVANVLVVASWTETFIDPDARLSNRMSRRAYQREARTDVNGQYVACSISLEFPVFVRAVLPGHETAEVELKLAGQNVVHRSFVVGQEDKAASRIIGVIKDALGNPIAHASAGLRGYVGRARTDSLGRFAIRSVPTGTQVLETRVLGAEPRAVELAIHSFSEHVVQVDFPLVRAKESIPPALARLDEVRNDPTGFQLRRHTLKGTFLTEEQIQAKPNATFADIMLQLPNTVLRKLMDTPVIMMKYDNEEALPGDSTITVRGCTPNYWLDERPMHSPLPGGLFPELQGQLNAGNIKAIEFYERKQIPPFFPQAAVGALECSVVVIWTKQPS
jgi:hypothetical protein